MGPLQMVIFYAPSPEVIKAYFSSSQSQFTLSRFTVFAYLENIDAGGARWCVVREQSTGLCNISQYPQKALSFSLLKALSSAFTVKNLFRQHAKPEFKHGE